MDPFAKIDSRFAAMAVLAELFFGLAEKSAVQVKERLRSRGRGSFKTLRPGPHTPMWNQLAALVRTELQPYGAKVRLARYLEIPRQRVDDFLRGRRRMPDAETTLRLLHWLGAKRAGRDLSL